MKLSPYIHFSGNAEEAINFYVAALGATIVQLGRYGDSPIECDEDWKQKVLHARLLLNENTIMLSDIFKGQTVSTGGNVQLSIDVEDIAKLEELFKKMAEGGTITMQLQDTFWGARFGMLRDKFGVSWMFSSELKKD